MKRFILALLLAGAAFVAAARERIPAADSRITYVGRTLVAQDGAVSFDWSGLYARIAFTGGYLALEAGDTEKDYFNVWIDREPSAEPDKIVVIDKETTVVLFSQKERKSLAHKVVIQKRTEGEQGRATFRAFEADGFLQAEGVRERMIEVIGDSYTCGYGSENSVRRTRSGRRTRIPPRPMPISSAVTSGPISSASPIPARASTGTTTTPDAGGTCRSGIYRLSTSRKNPCGALRGPNRRLRSSTWVPMTSPQTGSRLSPPSGTDTSAC
ncbi:MAG: hypothetical protein IKD95_01165 [Bacteroidales bacterium]|nr:hypothetical protein [Bacteroidales bacterium]